MRLSYVRCFLQQVNLALRLSLAVNVVLCSLGIFRVCLVRLSAAAAADAADDDDSDVIVDVITQRPGHVTSNASTTSDDLVPNIVHYIWYFTFTFTSELTPAAF